MRWTLTHVTALRIDAIAVLTRLRILAFVDIRAVASRFVQLESLVADAAEHAVNILAFTKDAQIAEHLTLVDVDARLLVAFVRVHESHFALAAERARIIEALTVLAKCRVVGAFVNVLADVTVAAETRVANAFERSFGVDALGVLIATAVIGETLVNVSADDAVSGETVTALTFESTRSVGTFRVAVAVESSEEAFVIVSAAWIVFVRFDRVSVLAAALE